MGHYIDMYEGWFELMPSSSNYVTLAVYGRQKQVLAVDFGASS